MNATPSINPIFVHASPRGASTYFFSVLRRIETLMCFNEAIIDVFSYFRKDGIARYKASQKWNVNHNFLDRGDFSEFVEAWDTVGHLYPLFPSYQNYLPLNGVLAEPLRSYLGGLIEYAQSQNKRPALCEIHSRGRAGALRNAFGGFHIAQYRDPISQFGSFYRPLSESGRWNFMAFPLLELGISGDHPLYSVVPAAWRPAVLPWPSNDRAQRWASAIEYMAMIASPQSDTIEKLFRWHLFSWLLSNLAAISYSDIVLDLDRAHDDLEYRQSVFETFRDEVGAPLDLGDFAKFSRYYRFETLDIPLVFGQVISTIKSALHDGRIERAIGALGQQKPTIAVADGVNILLNKMKTSLASFESSSDGNHVRVEDWDAVVRKNRMIWFNPALRNIAQRLYPVGAPVVRAARQAGILR